MSETKTDIFGEDFDPNEEITAEVIFENPFEDDEREIIDITTPEKAKAVRSHLNHPVILDTPDGKRVRYWVKTPGAGIMKAFMDRLPANKKIGKVTLVANNVDMTFLAAHSTMRGQDSNEKLMDVKDWKGEDFYVIKACFEKATELAGMGEDEITTEGNG